MAIYKCKMCGGELHVEEGMKVVECEYCGSSQTISSSNDDKILKLYARGNLLRTQNDFDKAYNIFEQIIVENPQDAEGYWNLLLCKYGITYVDDYDGSKKPTINRMSMMSIKDDQDYLKVLEYADVVSKAIYKQQITEIARIQEDILKIVKNEEPYDIFISYKETDEYGDRTEDSVLAQEIYNTLTKEGYKVFLSRVTLANTIGSEYEPYIYSALYSSKLMVLVTTKEEYVNAVWVKNEWSRFLKMMKEDSSKKIIPCFKHVDPYDLPKEIRNIQSVNFDKLGAIQDLVIGINKIFGKNQETEKVVISNEKTNKISNIIKRCNILIEDGFFEKAKELADECLNEEPENGELYSILLQCELSKSIDELLVEPVSIKDNINFDKIQHFGNEDLKNIYNNINKKWMEEKVAEIKEKLKNSNPTLKELNYIEDLYHELDFEFRMKFDANFEMELFNKIREKESIYMSLKDIDFEFRTRTKKYVLVSLCKEYVLITSDKQSSFDYDSITDLKITNDEYIGDYLSIISMDEHDNINSILIDTENSDELVECAKEIVNRIKLYDNKKCKIDIGQVGSVKIISEAKKFLTQIYSKPKLNIDDAKNVMNWIDKLSKMKDNIDAKKIHDDLSLKISDIKPLFMKAEIDLKGLYDHWVGIIFDLNNKTVILNITHEGTTHEKYASFNFVSIYTNSVVNKVYTNRTKTVSLKDIKRAKLEKSNVKNSTSHVLYLYVLINGEEKDIPFVTRETKHYTDIQNIFNVLTKYTDITYEETVREGCYVATCVYGSYNCPEVWTLRRFRDNTLGSTWYGRLFIRIYYAISPKLVKWFGDKKWFKKMWKNTLDRMVNNLLSKGVENTPYDDKKW